MRRLLMATAVLTGCAGVIAPQIAAPPPPEPIEVRTARSLTEVASIAVRELSDAGFDITVSDARAGIVTARRFRPRRENARFIACKNNIGGEGATAFTTQVFESTVTVTVTAREDSGQTVTRVASRVEGSSHDGRGNHPSPVECSSRGTIEQRIAAAVKG